MNTAPTANTNLQNESTKMMQELRTLLGDPKKNFQERLKEVQMKMPPQNHPVQTSEQVINPSKPPALPKTIQSLLGNTELLQNIVQNVLLQVFENILTEKTIDNILNFYFNGHSKSKHNALTTAIVAHKKTVLKELKTGLTQGMEQGMQEGIIQGLVKGLITGLKSIETTTHPKTIQSKASSHQITRKATTKDIII